jgi:hypothetical protein
MKPSDRAKAAFESRAEARHHRARRRIVKGRVVRNNAGKKGNGNG